MKDYARREVALATGLSALAGYVDAVGYLTLGGFFLSFMSGNSTRMGVGLASGQWGQAATAFGLIVLFVAGVVLGSTIARRARAGQRWRILAVEAGFLTAGAALCGLNQLDLGMALVVMAMGMENAVFQKNGHVPVGLTYMTGALVRIGQSIASALHGGPRWEWTATLVLWSGLAIGGALGGISFLKLGVAALWPAAVAAAGLAVMLTVMDRERA